MHQKLKAVYRDGIFVPQEHCDLPEGSEVNIIVQGPIVLAPKVTDPGERMSILKLVVERMQRNPIPSKSPGLTREDLHERR